MKNFILFPLILMASCSMVIVHKSKYDGESFKSSDLLNSRSVTMRTYNVLPSPYIFAFERSEAREELILGYRENFKSFQLQKMSIDFGRFFVDDQNEGEERLKEFLVLQKNQASSDLYIDIREDQQINVWSLTYQSLYLAMHLITLGIIPYYHSDKIVMNANVYDRNGNIVKTAKVSSQIGFTSWLPFIFRKDSHSILSKAFLKEAYAPRLNHLMNKVSSQK